MARVNERFRRQTTNRFLVGVIDELEDLRERSITDVRRKTDEFWDTLDAVNPREQLVGWFQPRCWREIDYVFMLGEEIRRYGFRFERKHVTALAKQLFQEAEHYESVGRIIEGLSRSKFWSSTAVFVLEDDAQDGPDHVDTHRSVFLAISPWTRGGVLHRFVNTTDVVATIEDILGMPSLSQYDHFGRPLRDIWADHPDLRPYVPVAPRQSMGEVNVARGPDVPLDLSRPDRIDDALFNHLLWREVKGPSVPYPSLHHAPVQEFVRGQ